MRAGLLILFIFFFHSACTKKNKIPGDIIPQNKMQAVLWDVMRADQYLADYVLNNDSSLNKKNESIRLYQQIFTSHKITKEEFSRSFSFYRMHPELMAVIMDSISKKPEVDPSKTIRPGISADSIKPAKADSIFKKKKYLRIKD